MDDDVPPVGQPQGTAHNSEGPGDETTNSRVKQALQDWGTLLVPATILGLFCRLFGLEDRVTAEIMITVFLVSAILVFASSLKRRLHVAIPACLSVIMAAVLIHLLLTPAGPRPIGPRPNPPAPEVGPPVQESPVSVTWAKWESELREKVKGCVEKKGAVDTCIASAIEPNYPKTNSQDAWARLHDDAHAGTVLMGITEVKNLLWRRIGIKDNFLGNGFALPHLSGDQYYTAQVPEYLVENHPENHPSVWTWELSPSHEHHDTPLLEILGNKNLTIEEIRKRSQGELDQFLESVKGRLGADTDTPAVIRFGVFPRENNKKEKVYSHKMGPPDAKRVFVLRLGPVFDLTLGKAAALSGHSLESEDSANDKIWIWVYLPDSTERLVRPAWGTIIKDLKKWLGK